MKQCTILVAVAALLSCSGTAKRTDIPEGPVQPTTDPTPISDSTLGLSKTSVFETPAPANHAFPVTEPGGNKLLARPFVGAPPLIPHDIAKFVPITWEVNECYDCHDDVESHFEDLRNKPGETSENLYGARFRCLACHVPQSNAPVLVPNSFRIPEGS